MEKIETEIRVNNDENSFNGDAKNKRQKECCQRGTWVRMAPIIFFFKWSSPTYNTRFAPGFDRLSDIFIS